MKSKTILVRVDRNRVVIHGKTVKLRVSPTSRRNGFFGSVRKAIKRSRGGYMVVDSEGYPVHTGHDLTKREALKFAKGARREGEKGIRIIRAKQSKFELVGDGTYEGTHLRRRNARPRRRGVL
jgi:hypothetical protein